jgi:hypothetical protein
VQAEAAHLPAVARHSSRHTEPLPTGPPVRGASSVRVVLSPADMVVADAPKLTAALLGQWLRLLRACATELQMGADACSRLQTPLQQTARGRNHLLCTLSVSLAVAVSDLGCGCSTGGGVSRGAAGTQCLQAPEPGAQGRRDPGCPDTDHQPGRVRAVAVD